MTTVLSISALFVICIGVAMLLANPTRSTNQIFAIGALLLTIEFLAINRSLATGAQFLAKASGDPLFWVRISAAIKVLFPSILWMLGNSIMSPKQGISLLILRSKLWLISGLGLTLLTFTNYYIPDTSLPDNITKGPCYFFASFINIFSWLYIVIFFIIMARKKTGVQRIELQFLVNTFSISALLSTSLFSIGHILGIDSYKQIALAIVVLSFFISSFGITYYRIFKFNFLIKSTLQKTLFTIILYLISKVVINYTETLINQPIAFIISLAISLPPAAWIDKKIRPIFRFEGEGKHIESRRRAIEVAKFEPNRDVLISRLEQLLRETHGANRVRFLLPTNDRYCCSDISLETSTPALLTLRDICWATPESLDRRRKTAGTMSLINSLSQNRLGLIVCTPCDSPEPSLIIAMGKRNDNSPYTYPEILQIQEFAGLIDNLLIRAQLNTQVAFQARIEALVLMSRGLAHDLKNLITPVSSFLSSPRLNNDPAIREDPTFTAATHSMRVISDYIEEAHFFSKELVPRLETVNPRVLIQDVLSSLRAKAERVAVMVESGPTGEDSIVADRVLLQRLMTNLVDNAIDASVAGGRVRIHGEHLSESQYRFSVFDSGTGIPPDVLPKIFEPYFTTKDVGSGVRGFGLGLAICQKIVDIHRGKIELRTAVGAGTTVEVLLPSHSGRAQVSPDEPGRVPSGLSRHHALAGR